MKNEILFRFGRLLKERRLPDILFWIHRLAKKYRQLPWRNYDMVSVVSEKPMIIFTGANLVNLRRLLQSRLSNMDLTIFYRAGWSLEDKATRDDRVTNIKKAQKLFPRHSFIVMANTEREVELLKGSGIRAEFLNENAFVNENIFFPRHKGNPAQFDAVIDSQLARYKRLELAESVSSLAVITFIMEERFNKSYGELVRNKLAHAYWANGSFWTSKYRRLNPTEVAGIYRKAKVGLILSAIEGANYVSIQYLLTGLPVVSTPSIGGRDIFFSKDYTAIVEPKPEAIADAVNYFIQNPPAADMIRNKTLEKIWVFRRRFENILISECGLRSIDAKWWEDFINNRPIRWQDLRQVSRLLHEANR
ncbi:MAG: glycosyltransferase [Candidatus Omnitrophota bacterium]